MSLLFLSFFWGKGGASSGGFLGKRTASKSPRATLQKEGGAVGEGKKSGLDDLPVDGRKKGERRVHRLLNPERGR